MVTSCALKHNKKNSSENRLLALQKKKEAVVYSRERNSRIYERP